MPSCKGERKNLSSSFLTKRGRAAPPVRFSARKSKRSEPGDRPPSSPLAFAARARRLFLISLLQEQLFKEQYPDKIEVCKAHADEGDEQANDKTDKTALLHPGAPSDDQLRDPVDKGNQKKNDLHESALFVEPSHCFRSPK